MQNNVTFKSSQQNASYENGSLWRDSTDHLYILAQITSLQANFTYIAICLTDGRRWKEQMVNAKDAVCGLEPFFGTVELKREL